MKFNWGTGIALALTAFIVFILFLVYKTTTTNTDLDAQDYYRQEINYQQRIDAIKNAEKLSGNLRIDQNQNLVIIKYPSDFENKEIEGHIQLFRPDNAALDKIIPINSRKNQQFIPKEAMNFGMYKVKVECEVDDVPYFMEKDLTLD